MSGRSPWEEYRAPAGALPTPEERAQADREHDQREQRRRKTKQTPEQRRARERAHYAMNRERIKNKKLAAYHAALADPLKLAAVREYQRNYRAKKSNDRR